MDRYPKRLIEIDLPIRRISEYARKDQNIRKGHLHTIHVWWATRPLASCRAVTLAAMLPDPADPNCSQQFRDETQRVLKPFTGRNLTEPAILRQSLLDFIADFAAWDAGVNPTYLSAARKLVAAAHPEGLPLVLDPFSGAGSIPFEALRIGANSFAGDLNPVAVLLNKVALEYLPKYRERLAEGVEKWGTWVLEHARQKLTSYYPADDKGNIPLAYIWARTITCEGPGCSAEVPLLGMLWLSHKSKNLVALRYHGDRRTKQVHVEIFEPKSEREIPSPIVRRMSATCPCCGFTTPYKSVREQLRKKRGGTQDARMLAVITLDKHGGRHFRQPEDADLRAAKRASRDLERIEKSHTGHWSFVPREPTPPDGTLGYRINKYGMMQWSDTYLPRQALALGTFCQMIGEARRQAIKAGEDAAFADAVASCLALGISNIVHYQSSVSIYALDHMISAFVQGSGLAMRPDFAEANPLMPQLVGGVDYSLCLVQAFLERESIVSKNPGTVHRGSATEIPLPDDSVDYVVTDPPYYDAVPYAALSDFCYVWLKRAVGMLHQDLFATELTPKANECILDPGPPAEDGPNKDRNYFESTIQAALADARRTLKPEGIAIVIFAHKGTAGWEALLNALVNAGWTVTASWPIDTERASRMRAKNSAVLASSVHLVCRPRENPDGSSRTEQVGVWRDVLAELPKRIHDWMPRLADEGVVGADAIFACIGPALEIFSRYSRVEKANGEVVTLKEYLEQVWAAVAKEALTMIFTGADATGFEEDARLTAMWMWTLKTGGPNGGDETEEEEKTDEEGGEKKTKVGGFVLEYDAARKIAQGLGAHLERLATVVEVKGETARLLSIGERAAHLFGKESSRPSERPKKKKSQPSLFAVMDEVQEEVKEWEIKAGKIGETILDCLHQSMILFGSGRGEALRRFLVDDGVGRDQRFWRLAQALSALYPAGTDEKRWVDGVLARKKGFGL